MKKILVGLSLLLLSNVVLASNYKVTVIFEEDGKLLSESTDTISKHIKKDIEYTRGYSSTQTVEEVKSIEYSCIDEDTSRKCGNILHTNNKDNKINMNMKVNESNELEIRFDYKKYLEKKKESDLDRFETYKVNKKIELKEQELVISQLVNKKLKIIIKEIK